VTRTSRRAALALVLILAGTAATAADAAAEAPARLVTPDALRAELAALRGRVVLLNVWATWCTPCLKEIPDLVAVGQALRDDGLVVLGLSVDEAADLPRVEEFRDRHFPGFRTLVRDAPDMDAVVGVVDAAWNEVVPTTYVIGRDGAVLERVQGRKSREAFEATARAALEARAAGAPGKD